MLHEPRRRRSWLIFDVRQKMNRILTLVLGMMLVAGCTHVMTPGEVQGELERRERAWRESLLRQYDLDALLAFIRQTITETKSLDGVDLSTAKLNARWSIGGQSMVCGDWYFSADPERNEFTLRTTFVRAKRAFDFHCVREGRNTFRVAKIEIEVLSEALGPITRNKPNKAPEPTTFAVTSRAIVRLIEMKQQNPNRDAARAAPAKVVAHLWRSAECLRKLASDSEITWMKPSVCGTYF
jgi:hypothetical protein